MDTENNKKAWAITIGLYPGILFGFRSYDQGDINTHVLYMPFIDIAFDIEK